MRTLYMLHALDTPIGDFGVTVRKGRKWANLEEGEAIELSASPSCGEGLGRVQEVWVGPFTDIPARYVEKEHQKRARTYSGLLDSMRYAYGDDFHEDEIVTVIEYHRMK